MKKILLIGLLLCVTAVSATACKSKYESSSCESPIRYSGEPYAYRTSERYVQFERVIEEDGMTFYFEPSGARHAVVERAVDTVKRVREFCEIPQPVYITDRNVTNVNTDGFWVNPNDSAELVCAVLLENNAEAELPFGIFAGVSANLLGVEELTEGNFELSEKYDYVKELQYPLFTERNTAKKERESAWKFAYKLGEVWLSEHTAEDLKTATKEDMVPVFKAVGAVFTDYYFPVGDFYYPLQAVTENLHYRFARDFEDCDLDVDLQSYPVLTDFIRENETLISEVCAFYGYEGFPEPVEAFFGKADEFGLFSYVTSYSDFNKNAILCYTASSFGRELCLCINYYGASGGYSLEWPIAAYFSYKYSSYAQMREYLDYSMQNKNCYVADAYTKEDVKFQKQIIKLYNEKFGKCDFEDFQTDKWIYCISYLYSWEAEKPMYMGAWISFVQYIHETYGFDVLMQFNRYSSGEINEKTLETYYSEWFEWLNAKLNG